MTPQTIIADLWAHGVTLRLAANGEHLTAPAHKLTPDQRATILAYKPELIDYLRAAHATTTALLVAAMKVCDRHGDNETARQEMRDQCMAVPPHLHADLLAHFNRNGLAQLGDPPDPATNSGIRPATGLPKRLKANHHA